MRAGNLRLKQTTQLTFVCPIPPEGLMSLCCKKNSTAFRNQTQAEKRLLIKISSSSRWSRYCPGLHSSPQTLFFDGVITNLCRFFLPPIRGRQPPPPERLKNIFFLTHTETGSRKFHESTGKELYYRTSRIWRQNN
ncbi:hypothetical protein E2C01_058565 [Portunus trituberculatus]|uniref:Uncharacterized protein n=1 Tax=Portunus trituberculatus TaxID=210409 RepID=A0A5B7H3C1_PORTR|nr:hypothetical protein [Portunus trituberculatus]